MKRDWLSASIMLLALALALMMPIVVDARPGGGNHSSTSGGSSRSSGSSGRSSSGGSSGSSRSGGGGGNVIIIPGGGGGGGSGGGGGGLLVFILIVVFIILIIYFVRKSRSSSDFSGGSSDSGWSNSGGGDNGGAVPMDSLPPPTRGEEVARFHQSDADIAAGLADIKTRDSAFDESHFVDRVETAYTILNQAWVAGDLTPSLPFLGEGEANRLQMQLQGDRAAGRRNVMTDVVLNGTRIVRVDKNSDGDVVIARIDGSAGDFYVDLHTNKVVDGWTSPRPYSEYWTFARSGAAKTTKTTYLTGNCPNCGAPLALGNISVCQFCGTPVRSTEYDWVLINIEQKYLNE